MDDTCSLYVCVVLFTSDRALWQLVGLLGLVCGCAKDHFHERRVVRLTRDIVPN